MGRYALYGVIFLGLLGLGYYMFQNQQRIEALTALNQNLSEQQNRLESELTSSNETIGSLETNLSDSQKKIQSQRREISSNRKVVTDLKSETSGLKNEQRQQSRDLEAVRIQKADKSQVENLAGEAEKIKESVTAANTHIADLRQTTGQNRQDIEGNRGEITRVGTRADTTATDLGQFKNSLEREIYNFELEKKGAIMKVVNVSLKLKKTNLKKQRYNLEIYADGRRIEKKNQHVNEPVVFYVSDVQKSYEVVVTKVGKNFVVGYLSVPKTSTKSPATVTG